MHRVARVEELEEELGKARDARGGGDAGGRDMERHGWYPQKTREGFMERTVRLSRKSPQACGAMLGYLISSTHRRKRWHKTNVLHSSEEGWKLAADNPEDKVFEASSRTLSEFPTQFNLHAPARILHLWGDLRLTRKMIMILLTSNRSRVGMLERSLATASNKQDARTAELELKETELELEAMERQSERLKHLIEAAEERFVDGPLIPPLLFQELQGCEWPLGRAIGDDKDFVFSMSTSQLEEVLKEVLRGMKAARTVENSPTTRTRRGKERAAAEMRYDSQDHGGFFERDEMEDHIVGTLSSMYDAAIPLQALARRYLGVQESKRRRESYKVEDEKIKLIQSFTRRMIEGFRGRELLLELRRKARLEQLGADTQILDMLAYAEDGDSFTVPKGEHFPKVTNLSEDVDNLQREIRVVSAAGIREGSVIVVGREMMEVCEKHGEALIVRRKPPKMLWEMLQVYNKLQECTSKEECVRGLWEKFISIARHYNSAATALTESDWINGVKALLGYDRDAQVQIFRALLRQQHGSVNDIVFSKIFNRQVENPAEELEQDSYVYTPREFEQIAEKMLEMWSNKFSFEDHERVNTEVPSRIFSIKILDLIIQEIDEFLQTGVSLREDVIVAYFKRAVQEVYNKSFPRTLSCSQWHQVFKDVDEECEEVCPHPAESIVRAEAEIRVDKAIRISSEKDATLHCCLKLECTDVKVNNEAARNNQVSDNDRCTRGACVCAMATRHRRPLKLVDKDSNDVMWKLPSKENDPKMTRSLMELEDDDTGDHWTKLCTTCTPELQVLHGILKGAELDLGRNLGDLKMPTGSEWRTLDDDSERK
ncbi:hypothetical protein GUITHDRAFT_144628 [Guillardia theta CCMP2712]|uniref:Uncharacterized protein n=1 Tax=Guillardia theta (strain CCMP2712) TaxID=905079 RepID=L1INV8_GUITC|nr:hypothetical protein GUITHDRAFT_144628 [Guillardia theta CCMP2712]EKX37943.1 hypothetical protein GUITHDRAFT_144628 [Guillardia theta CCMP2712]|eukprot:XP_005824923.1 hypothetical protein GUITHDRAFT_144628 [Guillardia theta CCMP2712]